MAYLKGIVGSFAVAGLFLGILAVALGRIGGFPIVPGAVNTAQTIAGGAGGGGGAAGASQALSQGLSTTYATLLTYIPTLVAPLIALTLSIIFALVVTIQMSRSRQAKLTTAAAGTGAGTFAFVFISTFLLGILAPSIPQALLQAGGIASAGIGGGNIASLGTLQFGNLLISGVLVGIVSAVTAGGVVYVADSLLPREITA